jgi:hypothetical protein
MRLVDSLYEQCGDHSRLKFSELEKHAKLLNIDVMAYDLRRNKAVLKRIDEIGAFEVNSAGVGDIAYKGLDVDGFISSNRTLEKLKRSLSELDGRWCKVYSLAVSLKKQVSDLSCNLRDSIVATDNLKASNAELSEQIKYWNTKANDLKAENTYLRNMIREYLYPSLADSILKSKSSDKAFGASQTAICAMTDGDIPSSFSESTASDQGLRSREDILFEKLHILAKDQTSSKERTY